MPLGTNIEQTIYLRANDSEYLRVMKQAEAFAIREHEKGLTKQANADVQAATKRAQLEYSSVQKINRWKWEQEQKRIYREQVAQEKARQKQLTATKSWSAKMTTMVSAQFSLMAAAATAYIGAAIKRLVSGTISWAGEVATASEALGVTVEEMSGLQYAAASTGTQIEKVNTLLTTLQQRLAEARRDPEGTYGKLFKEFGIDTQQNIIAVMDDLARMNNVGKVAQLVGARYAAVLTRIQTRFDGVSGAIEQARREHAVLDETAARNLDNLGAKWEQVGIRIKTSFANNIAPAITSAIEAFQAYGLAIETRGVSGAAAGPFSWIIANAVRAQRETEELIKLAEEANRLGQARPAGMQGPALGVESGTAFFSKQQVEVPSSEDVSDAAQKAAVEWADAFVSKFKNQKQVAETLKSALMPSFDLAVPSALAGGIQAPAPIAAEDMVDVTAQLAAMGDSLTYVDQLTLQIHDSWQEIAESGIGVATQALSLFAAQSEAAADAEALRTDKLLAQQELVREKYQAAGLEGTKQYEDLIAAQEKALAKQQAKEETAKAKAWDSTQQANAIEVIMNQALAIAKTFAEFGWPAGVIPAGIAGAQVALQLATINSQQNPYKAAFGWKVPGTPASGDSYSAMLTPGERVVDSLTSRRYERELDAMTSGNYRGGGDVNVYIQGDILDADGFTRKKMIPALKRARKDGVEF